MARVFIPLCLIPLLVRARRQRCPGQIAHALSPFARVDVPTSCAILKRMSARKIDGVELLQPITVQSDGTRLDLSASALTIRKNGIEFRTNSAIPAWTEMTVS